MIDGKEVLQKYHTDKEEDVFILQVYMELDRKSNFTEETVDGYGGGEIGIMYAQKLLFRLANCMILKTPLGELPWKEDRGFEHIGKREYEFFKAKVLGNSVRAMMKYVPQRQTRPTV